MDGTPSHGATGGGTTSDCPALHRRGHRVSPRRGDGSIPKAIGGWPFMGRPDIFADRAIDAAPFPVTVEGNPAFYDEPVTTEDGKFPALESLIAWAAKSGDPRRGAASAVLLRDPRLRVDVLVERAARMGGRHPVG